MMENSVLVQCLEFSRLLISNQKPFQFEVKLASGFSFNFNTLDQESTKSRTQEVKKKSPSTLKRNAARKLRFLQDKKTSSVEKETLPDSFKCDQCDHQANCKASLMKHVGIEHQLIPQLDGFNDSNSVKETSSKTEVSNIKQVEVRTEIDKPKEDTKKKEMSSTFKFFSEMNEEEREVHDRNQEEEAKASGSWCYECKDIFKNNTVLKMHMHTVHKSKV